MGRITLGLTNEEFFALTPRQFHLLVAQHRERMEHQELLAAIVASEVANRSQRHPEKWVMPIDYMPSKANQKQKTPRRSRSRGQTVSDSIRRWADTCGRPVITTKAQSG
jgi:hypothetical protein